MNAVVLDLAVLNAEDLQTVRLAAQVMRHRADVAVRPRVAVFFAALADGVDHELARRLEAHDLQTGSITLTFGRAVDLPVDPGGDRRFLIDSLDLLGANPQLSSGVRMTFASIRDRLLRTH